jgi:hypothetical protein
MEARKSLPYSTPQIFTVRTTHSFAFNNNKYCNSNSLVTTSKMKLSLFLPLTLASFLVPWIHGQMTPMEAPVGAPVDAAAPIDAAAPVDAAAPAAAPVDAAAPAAAPVDAAAPAAAPVDAAAPVATPVAVPTVASAPTSNVTTPSAPVKSNATTPGAAPVKAPTKKTSDATHSLVTNVATICLILGTTIFNTL